MNSPNKLVPNEISNPKIEELKKEVSDGSKELHN